MIYCNKEIKRINANISNHVIKEAKIMADTVFCSSCGSPLPPGTKFCSNCGTPAVQNSAAAPQNTYSGFQPAQEPVTGDRIRLCPDGKYRWIYSFKMLRNPTILFTVFKVLAIAGAVPALLTMIMDIADNGISGVVTGLKVYGIMVLIFLPLSLLAYLIVALMFGKEYIVLFEMDENGVVHAQQPKQYKKAQAIGWLTSMAGTVSGNIGMVGQGMLVASRNSLVSDFSSVKSLTSLKNRNTIKVDSAMSHNQVYVPDEDYDFVWGYITSHCPGAKIN